MALFELKKVCKSFGDGGGKVEVLKGLDFKIEKGDSLAVLGPSGVGKSTLLNLLGGLDRPDSGEVRFDGDDLREWGEDALAEFRNQRVGFVFQLHHLLPQCTALENVLIPTLAGRGEESASEVERYGRELLERVGLSERVDFFPSQLSGGERLRVAVARALICKPDVLLADEPTGALDVKTAKELMELFVELNKDRGVALVVVTHVREHAMLLEKQYQFDGGKLTDLGVSSEAV